jgi:FkbM family methyltransferase
VRPTDTSKANRLSWISYKTVRVLARSRIAEPEVLGLAALVRPGDQVFDVGGAYGMYTIPLAHLVGPKGSVHTFEPQLMQHRIARTASRILHSRQVTVVQAALGAETGRQELILPLRFGIPLRGHAHIAHSGWIRGPRTYLPSVRRTTDMHTIDSWAETHGLTNVTFIKADVEGYEHEVLAGATATIDRSMPSLLLEVEDRHAARYGRKADHFADSIRTTWPDYDMYTWTRGAWQPVEHLLAGVRNYLFATRTAFVSKGKNMAYQGPPISTLPSR